MIDVLMEFVFFLIAGFICWFGALAVDEYKRDRAEWQEAARRKKDNEL